MREIEFRGKIKETGEWVYGTLLRIPAPPQCIGDKKPDTYFIQFVDPRYKPDWNMPYSMVQAEVNPETIETVLQALENSILKKKIKDKKIYYENLKQQINNEGYDYTDFTEGKIEVLQELLEDK